MMRILVVDDEPGLREVIRVILEEHGYTVDTGVNGRDGLRLLQQTRPDLVLTDISMPDMEGIEFLKALRSSEPELPVIAMSGDGVGSRFLKAARMLGATFTLAKPFSNADLLTAIRGSTGTNE